MFYPYPSKRDAVNYTLAVTKLNAESLEITYDQIIIHCILEFSLIVGVA